MPASSEKKKKCSTGGGRGGKGGGDKGVVKGVNQRRGTGKEEGGSRSEKRDP